MIDIFLHVGTQRAISLPGFGIIGAMPAPVCAAVPPFYQVAFSHNPVTLFAQIIIHTQDKIILDFREKVINHTHF